MTTKEIISCPFCGMPSAIDKFDINGFACVKCAGCGAVVSFVGAENPEAFALRWNMRDGFVAVSEPVFEKNKFLS